MSLSWSLPAAKVLKAYLCCSLPGVTAVSDKSHQCSNWPCKPTPSAFLEEVTFLSQLFYLAKGKKFWGPQKSQAAAQPADNLLSFEWTHELISRKLIVEGWQQLPTDKLAYFCSKCVFFTRHCSFKELSGIRFSNDFKSVDWVGARGI